MRTVIHLVRHGVTDWNNEGRVQGRSDLPLTAEGVRQAQAVAERLAAEGWDAIYSSPLKRAAQTAGIIARRMGHSQVVTDVRLVEREMGAAEGMYDMDLPMLWPGVPWDAIPGMEPRPAVAARAHEALREIAGRHAGGRVICVSHGSLIRAFLRSIVPPGTEPAEGVALRNVAVTAVCHDGTHFRQEGEPDHRHILREGIEYTGEKGRLSAEELIPLLPEHLRGAPGLEPVIWRATAVESAWDGDTLVGFARAFTDGIGFGCIDLAVARPGYDQVIGVLIARLKQRYPTVPFTLFM